MTRFELDYDAMEQRNIIVLTRHDSLHNLCIRDFNATESESIQAYRAKDGLGLVHNLEFLYLSSQMSGLRTTADIPRSRLHSYPPLE
ncbi:hypothetical protein K443DRAFT_366633 [Laccaria amethystina LaAM-08-1]|uniref:Uncharacterized protein n=1 Tax=Laccaria amethystina LaAM-08-1 TaxID=1095629 RepID=A0A0C9XJC8_9AGAR|nr:hypothetical protein K443DRAFT_366633 [Laccaria amethystina LaAM-08-1]